MKHDPYGRTSRSPVRRTVALVFDRPTLRTQVSFTAGIAELGGNPMTVDGGLAAMGSRESVEDVARVLGRQAVGDRLADRPPGRPRRRWPTTPACPSSTR